MGAGKENQKCMTAPQGKYNTGKKHIQHYWTVLYHTTANVMNGCMHASGLHSMGLTYSGLVRKRCISGMPLGYVLEFTHFSSNASPYSFLELRLYSECMRLQVLAAGTVAQEESICTACVPADCSSRFVAEFSHHLAIEKQRKRAATASREVTALK